MSKKLVFQIILFLTALLIAFIVYFSYFYKDIVPNNNSVRALSENLKNSDKSNIITDLYYISSDNNQNFYEIKSKTGRLDLQNSSVIFMNTVSAKLYSSDVSPIIITSNYAKYDSVTYDTTFSEDVKITYLNHMITSEFMSLSTEKNLASLSKDIIYNSLGIELKADVVEIDLITRNSKIFMDNKNKKVLVTGNN
jgi:hypothetical protein